MPLYEEISQKKKLDLQSKIPAEWVLHSVPSPDEEPDALVYLNKILPSRVVEITGLTASQLVTKILDGQLTAYEVTKSFCQRAALAQQLTNCLTEIFFDSALQEAQKLDEYYLANGGKTVGPLHGLPVSLKDQVNLKGIDTSIGYAAAFIDDDTQRLITGRDKHSGENSLIADLLHQAGAVFYVKTTVPMAMMASDTTTPTLFGDTLNGRNRHFSPGGSSGGEGALILAGGSPIGLGTDIGGSIRIPLIFNGLFGLRPSSNRLPYLNVANSMLHQPVIPSVIGPLLRSLDDIELLTKTIIDMEPWEFDPKVPPIPWRTLEPKSSYNFGYWKTTGYINPHPLFSRAIDMVRELLSSKGHDVFEFQPPVAYKTISDMVGSVFLADAVKEISTFAALAEEPVSAVVRDLCPEPWEAISVSQHWDQLKLKYELQQQFNEGWLQTRQLTKNGEIMDGFIFPGWCSTSFKVGRHLFSMAQYTDPFNGLDYSVCIVPVTTVDQLKDRYPKEYVPINTSDELNFKEYDPESFHGMPVCIQVVARRYQEEKVIALAKAVHELLHG